MADQNETLETLAAQLQQVRDTIAQQQDTIAQQQAQLQVLQARLETERAAADPAEDPAGSVTAAPTGRRAQRPRAARTSRRALLKLGGAAAAATAAAATAGLALGQGEVAYAATGGNFILGQSNDASSTTLLTHSLLSTPSPLMTLDVSGLATSTALLSNGGFSGGIGVNASASGTGSMGVQGTSDVGYGVFGAATNPGGTGVQGSSNSGLGGYFQGGQAPLAFKLASTAGAPTTGAHIAGELYLDSAATLWICTSGGTPGTWVQMLRLGQHNVAEGTTLTPATTPAPLSLLIVDNSATAGSTGLEGHGSSVGVYGYSPTGLGGYFQGGRAPLSLAAAGTAGAPTAGIHLTGDMYLDSNATLWICIGSGTPGTWVRLTGVANGTIGGSVHYLAAPARLLDARSGASSGLVNRGPLTANEIYTLQVAALMGSNIPGGALGLICNVTVLGPTGNGNLSLFPTGAPILTTASMTFVAGAFLANHVSAALGGGKVDIQNQSGGATPLVVDAVGFIM